MQIIILLPNYQYIPKIDIRLDSIGAKQRTQEAKKQHTSTCDSTRVSKYKFSAEYACTFRQFKKLSRPIDRPIATYGHKYAHNKRTFSRTDAYGSAI